MGKTHPNEFVLIVMWVHLVPSRTQKLSTCTPTILGGRLPGKIGNANTNLTTSVVRFFFLHSCQCPGPCCGARHLRRRQAPSSSVDRCHSLSSLHLPPAALASLPPGRGLFAAAISTTLRFCSVLVFIRRDTPSVKNQRFLPPPSRREARTYGIRWGLPRRFAPRNDVG